MYISSCVALSKNKSSVDIKISDKTLKEKLSTIKMLYKFLQMMNLSNYSACWMLIPSFYNLTTLRFSSNLISMAFPLISSL